MDPSLEIEQLPEIDAVVLSHWHGDHFDQVAQERLDRDLPVVTTAEASRALGEIGFTRSVPLETWSSHDLSGGGGRVRITALPGRHAPAGLDVALPDVMGSCLEFYGAGGAEEVVGAPDLRLYISGDTLMFEGIREIAERVPQLDLALIHLGGTRVFGVTVTMDAEQGLELMRTLRPDVTVPIHYNDYDSFKSPLSDFQELVRDAGLESRVAYVSHGDVLPIGRSERARP
jgi:L-ascorbate metabolism protein UlaG (beta-lactamase superfamily)